MIYNDSFPSMSPEDKVLRRWNCACSLKSTVAYIGDRLPVNTIIGLYRTLYRQGQLTSSPEVLRRNAWSAEKFKQDQIAKDTSYARWKGWTGEGAVLRKILEKTQ